MKPVYNKTALENILLLLKEANPGLIVDTTQVALTTPVTDPITKLTTLTVTAVIDQGYSGGVDVTYTRRTLEDYVGNPNIVTDQHFATLEELVESLTSTLGLVKSEVTVSLIDPPTYPSIQQSMTLSMEGKDGAIYDGYSNITITLKLPPTYLLTSNPKVIYEGLPTTFTLTTTNVDDGVLVPYHISGATTSDLNDTPLTGNFTVTNGQSTVTIPTSATIGDYKNIRLTLTDHPEIYTGVEIKRTPPTFALSTLTTSIDEGEVATFKLITTNVSDWAYIRYMISGVAASEITGSGLSGTFSLNNGQATLNIQTVATYNPARTMTLTVANGSGISESVIINPITYPGPGQVGIFYGGYVPKYVITNIVTRISNLGTLVGTELVVSSGRYNLAGAGYSATLGVFFGGGGSTHSNVVTRISNRGILIGTETTAGTARAATGGAGYSATLGIFYAGDTRAFTPVTLATRISNLGALVGSETNVGLARYNVAGAGYSATLGVFYGGLRGGSTYLDNTTRISNTGVLIGAETNLGTMRAFSGGVGYSATLGIFYAGNANTSNLYNLTTRISNTGTLIGTETNLGVIRTYLAGAGYSSTIGIFYGGYTSNKPSNAITRISNTGTLAANETYLGTPRHYLSGSGYR